SLRSSSLASPSIGCSLLGSCSRSRRWFSPTLDQSRVRRRHQTRCCEAHAAGDERLLRTPIGSFLATVITHEDSLASHHSSSASVPQSRKVSVTKRAAPNEVPTADSLQPDPRKNARTSPN